MEEKDLSRLKIEKPAPGTRFRRRRRYLWWIISGVIVLLIALGFGGLLSPAVEVRGVSVSLTYPSQTLTLLNASGYVVAQRKASVASKTTGRLVWIGVEEGSAVKKGQIIARLENDDVTAAREEAEANFRASEKNLDQAKAELKDAQANFKRNKELLAEGIVSKSEFDTAEARYKKASAGVEAARAAVNAGKAALKAADVALEYTLIRAPFDAVVLTKNADIGDIITPLGAAANAKAAVVTIADMDSLQVEVDVSESNIGKVGMNRPSEVRLDALPEARFPGSVHMIVPTADRSKASVLVKVRFKERDTRILPEMSAKVAFLSRELGSGENAPRTTVDPSAVVTRDSAQTVFVINGNIVSETPVKLGEKMGDAVEVIEGVKAGDRVVADPPKRLKDGSKVTVMEE